ncbi:GNAT family N-acetyltransferase [Vibrio stylophorae]|nr:GNAT family N-acetyltransferase [Vibrio stylophorae]
MPHIEYRMGTFNDVLIINQQMPEFDDRTTRAVLEVRLANRDYRLLVAYVDDMPVGYQLVYALSATESYLWLAGVCPDYRQYGIATALRTQQEFWAKGQGYQQMRVKSMNRYPAMLQLLIRSGYQIDGYEDAGSSHNSKICFCKAL